MVGEGEKMGYWVVFEKQVEKVGFLGGGYEKGVIRGC